MRNLLLSLCIATLPLGATLANEPARTSTRQAALPQQQQPTLRADVSTQRDILTLGDLVLGLPPAVAQMPAFRAPALGETGTIQAHRIAEALRAQGVDGLLDGGAAQVVVTRAARRISMAEVDAAVKKAIEERFGVEARSMTIQLDSGLPTLVVEPELKGLVQIQDLAFDPRSRRLSATLTLPGSAQLRLRPARVAGQLVDTVEVVVPIRALNRGEIIQATDVSIERRARDAAGQEFLGDAFSVIGKAARRSLSAGQLLRNADLQRQEVVARNEVVTVVFETPGLVLTMRGRAQEAGAQGDTINVMNIQSKKILQGTVLGPGRVSVTPSAAGGRIASVN